MPREKSWKARTILLGAIAAGPCMGCGSHVPETTSPITSAESEAGRKARAEDERIAKERRDQEARARRRAPALPAEG